MKRAVIVIAVAVVAASIWAVASTRASAPGTISVSAAGAVTAGASVIAAPGRVEPISEEIQISAEIRGRLDRVLVDEGDAVSAGQVLATIDARDARAAVASAEARLGIARAEFDRLVHGARAEERREADALRVQAQAALDQATTERERRERLYRDGAIAAEEFERADRDMRVALAKRDELAERARLVSADARDDDKARAQANVDFASAEVAEAKAALAKTELRAPIAGTILRRAHKAGEVVAPEAGQSLVFVMADTSHLRVRADVDETDVARLSTGGRATVTAAAYGDRRFGGVVSRIGQTLGKKTIRTDEPTEKADTKILETLIDLDPDVRLPLGLRVDVFIEAPDRAQPE